MSLLSKLSSILILLAIAPMAQAHGLYARAKLSGNQLRVEAWFDDDTPAEKATVRIVLAGIILRNGLTDEKGIWITDAMPAGKYQIQVDAGAGHRRDIEFVMPEGATSQTAGPTKSEVKVQQWLGVILGLLVLVALVLLGKRLLHRQAA